MFKGGYYTENVDIWSAGATLYTMVTGEPPFDSESIGALEQ
jgi:serine/threonine protein kinase